MKGLVKRKREREKKRERERETDRQRETDTDRQTDRDRQRKGRRKEETRLLFRKAMREIELENPSFGEEGQPHV